MDLFGFSFISGQKPFFSLDRCPKCSHKLLDDLFVVGKNDTKIECPECLVQSNHSFWSHRQVMKPVLCLEGHIWNKKRNDYHRIIFVDVFAKTSKDGIQYQLILDAKTKEDITEEISELL